MIVSLGVLNGRIYRAGFLPLLLALVVAGFSLAERPAPLGSNLAPDAFNGAGAFAELQSLATRFPDRRPGSAGDRELAEAIANTLQGLGGTANGGFAVATRSVQAQTIDGKRTLTTVIAQRPGATGAQPIVILAHRDATARGEEAELSGTAVLLELARVFAAGATQRTIILVSTSGGSGGNAGARDFAMHPSESAGGVDGGMGGGPIDAAIVLGNLAGKLGSRTSVASFSAAPGSAPALLQRTVSQALSQQAGVASATPGMLDQLAQLAFPLTAGEQGPLNAQGIPAVLVQVGGEQGGWGSHSEEPVGAARLEAFGRAVLAAVYALDSGPEVSAGSGTVETGLPIRRKLIPGWALRLIVAALLLPALLVICDGLARLQRRGEPLLRWALWAPACGLPFLACALFAILLGQLDVIPTPYPPVSPSALPLDSAALETVLAAALVLVLAWLAWAPLMRRLGLPVRPTSDAAGIVTLLVLGCVAVLVWAIDPITALLLAPALHLWLPLAAPAQPYGASRQPSRSAGLVLVALGAAPVALLIAFYAHQLGLGLGGTAHTAVLLLAGGRVGVAGAVLWSTAFGCLAAAVLVALIAVDWASLEGEDPRGGEREPVLIRGGWAGSKSHYAGPGSLGGTESALRR
jgi:Peptidase family M28